METDARSSIKSRVDMKRYSSQMDSGIVVKKLESSMKSSPDNAQPKSKLMHFQTTGRKYESFKQRYKKNGEYDEIVSHGGYKFQEDGSLTNLINPIMIE